MLPSHSRWWRCRYLRQQISSSSAPGILTVLWRLRPESPGKFEIETGDDFALTQPTSITHADFTGLIPSGASLSAIRNIAVEVYRVFPADSDVGRTSGSLHFRRRTYPRESTPSDVALDSRLFSAGSSGLSVSIVNPNFAANNSVTPGGIHPQPNQTTHGNGPVSGQEIKISADIATPFDLAAGQYFFVPQVELSSGDFYGFPHRGRSLRRERLSRPASPIFRAGRGMIVTEVLHPIGCGSAPTSLAWLTGIPSQRLTRPLTSVE